MELTLHFVQAVVRPSVRAYRGRIARPALIASIVGVASLGAHGASTWRAVPGSQLRPTFVEHELADGVHYAYQFHRDGTFTGYEMAREVRGTWRIAEDELCWTWHRPRGAEECFVIERAGADVRLIRDGAEFLSGRLSSVKRKGTP